MAPEAAKSINRNDTRASLVLSALALFAQHGIDAVSMRTINNAAGSKNASAVHYYFGNKLGIIEAIIGFIKSELDSYRNSAVEALERRAETGERLTCREIMWDAFHPYYQLYTTPGYGRDALRFLARQHTELNKDIQDIFNRDPNRIDTRFDKLLANALPDMPDDIRKIRYLFFWTLMVQGFCGSERLDQTTFGDLRADSRETSIKRFFDYLVAGLEGPVTT